MKTTRVLAAGAAAAMFATIPMGAQARQDGNHEKPMWQVTKVTSTTLDETDLSDQDAVATDRVRTLDGKLVGYDSYSLHFTQHQITIRIGIALKGGVILATLRATEPAQGQDLVFRGPIQGGNGTFSGIQGRLRAVVAADDTAGKALVTLRWRTHG